MALFWLVLGVVLLLVELRHLAFYALFVAAGSLVASVVAVIAPSAVPLQTAVATVVAVLGVVAVRPTMSRAFHRHGDTQVARGVHGGLVGQEAITLDAVGTAYERGHVQLTGERWLAVSGGGVTIAAGTPVVVTAVEGTTLVVWPLAGPSLDAGGGAGGSRAEESGTAPPDGADGSTT